MVKTKARKLPPNIKAHGNGYRAVFTVNGKQVRSKTFKTIAQAVEWAEVYRKADKAVWNLGRAHDEVLKFAKDRGISEGTEALYSSNQAYLDREFGRDRGIHTIHQSHLEQWRDRLKARGVGDSTIYNVLMPWLRRLIHFAMARGCPAKDPFLGFPLPRVRKQRWPALPAPRIKELLAQWREIPRKPRQLESAQRDGDVAEMIFRTGMRRSEVARLRPEDIDFDLGTIAIRGKTGPRTGVISEPLRPLLKRLVLPIIPKNIDSGFWRMRRDLKIKQWSPHILRHSFATDLAKRGIDPWELATLMGHQNVALTTSVYYHGDASKAKGLLDAM